MPRKSDEPVYQMKSMDFVDQILQEQEDSDEGSDFLPLSSIIPKKNQPRRYFDSEKLEQLAISIRTNGILQPILVRPLENGQYELVAGERRYRAAQLANLDEIPSIIRDLSDEETTEIALTENLQREDLSTLEKLEGILQLLQIKHFGETGEENRQWIIDHLFSDGLMIQRDRSASISERWPISEQTLNSLGVSIATMLKWMRLLSIPNEIKQAHLEGKLNFTKAIEIAKLKDENKRNALLHDAITQNLSLREIQSNVKELKSPKKKKQNKSQKLIDRASKISKWVEKAQFWGEADKVAEFEELLRQLEEFRKSVGN